MANNNNDSKSLYDKLIAIGHLPQEPLIKRKDLSLKENQSVYKLVLSGCFPTAAFCVDGVIITEGQRCDKLVLIDTCADDTSWIVVFVELKGVGILHAIEQLRVSIRNKLFEHSSNKCYYARVVGRSFPSNRSDPRVEKAKLEFKRCFNCDLKMLKSCQPDSLIV